jgi:integrase
MTVAEFLDLWLASVKSTITRGTQAAYDQHVRNMLKPKLGGIRLPKLTEMHVSWLFRVLADDGYSTAMQRKAGVTLTAALSWGVSPAKLLRENVAKAVKLPRHEKLQIKMLEPEQTAAFLKAALPDRLYPLYVLAIDSGCRQGGATRPDLAGRRSR